MMHMHDAFETGTANGIGILIRAMVMMPVMHGPIELIIDEVVVVEEA